MPLCLNEVREHAPDFSKDWENKEKEKAVDLHYRPQPFPNEISRLEFLFDLYMKYTEPIFTKNKKGKK